MRIKFINSVLLPIAMQYTILLLSVTNILYND